MNNKIETNEHLDIPNIFDYDIKMSLVEFNQRCMPGSTGQTTEFELKPIDLAVKNGVKYSIKTINNEVYFKEIK